MLSSFITRLRHNNPKCWQVAEGDVLTGEGWRSLPEAS